MFLEQKLSIREIFQKSGRENAKVSALFKQNPFNDKAELMIAFTVEMWLSVILWMLALIWENIILSPLKKLRINLMNPCTLALGGCPDLAIDSLSLLSCLDQPRSNWFCVHTMFNFLSCFVCCYVVFACFFLDVLCVD